MTIFYHVSTNLQHPGVFEPRVPGCRHKHEDSVTPRISVATSIADCFTAFPNGGMHLDELNDNRRGLYLIFKIDTEQLGINEKDIVTSEELYEKDWVRDADETNEHWITKPFIISEDADQFLIKVMEWNEEPMDILPYSIYKIADEEYDGDYLQAYQDTYQELVPCSVRITDLDYIHPAVEKGQDIHLYVEDTLHKMELIEFLTEHYDVTLTENEDNSPSLAFRMNKTGNLTSLFLYEDHLMQIYP